MELLCTQNYKTVKGEKWGWLTGILYMAPATSAGGVTVCPWSDAGCRAACLYTAGRGRAPMVQQSRIKKTRLFLRDPDTFIAQLDKDLYELERRAAAKRLRPAARLNGTSDIAWYQKKYDILFANHPSVIFYDYTKDAKRMRIVDQVHYKLTFSRGTNNDKVCKRLLSEGYNVAVVFDEVPVGSTWWEYPVINGDLSDLRFMDPPGSIIGLVAKGKAAYDTSGFVVRTKGKKA